jgi:hypothetical protein
MNDGDDLSLPADLGALERRLATRSGPECPPELRHRILTAVTHELRRAPVGGRPGWRWLVGAAAALLLGINFSTSVVSDMDWQFAERTRPEDIVATARRVQDLVPEMPEREVYRQALLLAAGGRTVPVPALRMSLDRLQKQRDRESWDMH